MADQFYCTNCLSPCESEDNTPCSQCFFPEDKVKIINLDDNCPICLTDDDTIYMYDDMDSIGNKNVNYTVFDCGHWTCMKCFCSLKEPTCPICRASIVGGCTEVVNNYFNLDYLQILFR